jgi:hypothetical protein
MTKKIGTAMRAGAPMTNRLSSTKSGVASLGNAAPNTNDPKTKVNPERLADRGRRR